MGERQGLDLKKIRKLIMIVAPMIATLLSAYLTSVFPVSASFIPEDQVYGISLTLYSGVFVALFTGLDYLLNYIIKQKTIIKVKFAANRPDFNKMYLVHCDFNQDTATIYMEVKLAGNPKKFLQREMKLTLPVQVTAQKIEKYSKYYKISADKRSVIIDLEKLFNTEKTERIEDSINIGFKVIKSDDEVQSYIETVIIGPKRKIILEKNDLLFTK
ncbi:hypothetical protein [Gracilibacillus phocaeensis]|uniref:hypothetical protein n=1 Tax=Gracilibacillus phocaeensis TaxID=2042304 RepID=UPI0010327A4B|nr:hypothetical protein [Gracilibacillus phocaeensis]